MNMRQEETSSPINAKLNLTQWQRINIAIDDDNNIELKSRWVDELRVVRIIEENEKSFVIVKSRVWGGLEHEYKQFLYTCVNRQVTRAHMYVEQKSRHKKKWNPFRQEKSLFEEKERKRNIARKICLF